MTADDVVDIHSSTAHHPVSAEPRHSVPRAHYEQVKAISHRRFWQRI